ncbi:hypothetical protein QR680_003877 [Steinernema hermaphroditum]|uniref:Uncharacterized protein n=1 Tax=Steinernema hermaphroditum TaxID=289476 RepID=A0AA39HMZ1_9BILA|nr:hypothetical protein QR680_003877 [Steinernema hermaphroditum]
MRSVIGLLLLLPCCLVATYENAYENVIACAMHRKRAASTRAPVAFVWSNSSRKFVERPAGLGDCGLDAVGALCRIGYANVSYAVNMNKTRELLVDVPWYYWVDESKPEQDKVKATLFKCQDYVRAKELDVPKGSWSDRIAVAQDYESKCENATTWLARAKSECRKEPSKYDLGAKCGEKNEYLEMVFVCDNPKNDTLFEADEKFMKLKETYQHESQIAMLERFFVVVEKVVDAKMNNDTEMENIYTKQLQKVFESARETIRNVHNLNGMLEMGTVGPNHLSYTNDYPSRERSFSKAKEQIKWIGMQRSNELFGIALDLFLTNDTVPDELSEGRYRAMVTTLGDRYDVDALFDTLKDRQWNGNRFPELKERVVDYYVDYIKNHTLGISREHLGFLNESGAHAHLIDMYKEIFNLGLIDRKYLSPSTAETYFRLYLIASVLVIIFIVCAFLRSEKAMNHVADFKIHFQKYGLFKDEVKLAKGNIVNPNFEI